MKYREIWHMLCISGSLPPRGGSGLKFVSIHSNPQMKSPSTRREWIEIPVERYFETLEEVSLHAEGVD